MQHAHDWSAFETTLPQRPYVGCKLPNGGFYGRTLDRVSALKWPLIQPNTPRKKVWLPFDIDRSDAAWHWEASGIMPNFVMENPVNGNCHYAYLLDDPVWLDPAKNTTNMKFLGRVQRGLTRELDADVGYSGLLMKNPLSDRWKTYRLRSKGYRLRELADHVDMDLPIRHSYVVQDEGRKVTLFNLTRYWAYNHRHQFTSWESWSATVHSIAEDHNRTFPASLGYGVVRSIAKSVAKWVWSKYTGSGKNRLKNVGAASIPMGSSIQEAQSLGAIYTAELKSRTTLAKVVDARSLLGVSTSQSAIAVHCGLSLSTIKRHWSKSLPASQGGE